MSRSADWHLRLDCDAWTLNTPEGATRLALDGPPENVLAACEAGKGTGRLAVVLGDRWLRYLVLSWPPGMRRSDERRGFMAHRFRLVHDVVEPDWVLTMDAGVADYPALACAVPMPLLRAVLDFAELRGLGMAGVTGDFAAAYNACQPRFDEPPGTLAAFALHRGRRLTAGLWRDGTWLAVRSQNVAGQASAALAVMLGGWRSEFAAADAVAVLYGAAALATPPGWRHVGVEAP